MTYEEFKEATKDIVDIGYEFDEDNNLTVTKNGHPMMKVNAVPGHYEVLSTSSFMVDWEKDPLLKAVIELSETSKMDRRQPLYTVTNSNGTYNKSTKSFALYGNLWGFSDEWVRSYYRNYLLNEDELKEAVELFDDVHIIKNPVTLMQMALIDV